MTQFIGLQVFPSDVPQQAVFFTALMLQRFIVYDAEVAVDYEEVELLVEAEVLEIKVEISSYELEVEIVD